MTLLQKVLVVKKRNMTLLNGKGRKLAYLIIQFHKVSILRLRKAKQLEW